MVKHKSLVYVRSRRKLIQKGIQSKFDFKIYEKGKVNGPIKSISIYSEKVAIAYGKTILIKYLGDYDNFKTFQCLDEISVVKFRDEGVLVVGLLNGIIECVAMCSMQCIATLKGHYAAVNDICFCADFKHMFSCSRDGSVKKWNVWKNSCELTLEYHTDSVKNILIHEHYKKKKYLLSSGYDGCIYFYNIEKNKLRKKLKIEMKGPIENMCIYRKKYIVFSVKNYVKIYSFGAKQIIKSFFVCSKTIFYLSSFHNHILAASLDKNVYFIDPYKEIGEDDGVVVGTCRFFNLPVCIAIYKNVVALGEFHYHWSIQIYDSQQQRIINTESKNVRLHEIVSEQHVFTNKRLDAYLKQFKYRDALCYGMSHDPHCLPNLLDMMSKQRTLDVACKVNSAEEMILFLKYMLKEKNIDEVFLEMVGFFLSANKTVGLGNNDIKMLLKYLLHKFEKIQLWMKVYSEMKPYIPQLTF